MSAIKLCQASLQRYFHHVLSTLKRNVGKFDILFMVSDPSIWPQRTICIDTRKVFDKCHSLDRNPAKPNPKKIIISNPMNNSRRV